MQNSALIGYHLQCNFKGYCSSAKQENYVIIFICHTHDFLNLYDLFFCGRYFEKCLIGKSQQGPMLFECQLRFILLMAQVILQVILVRQNFGGFYFDLEQFAIDVGLG